eukprot:TRINITY_DN462_c0_g2_i2.p1 TRINITY_DN462_c0_g2~~TRINITY_DN462_c0_g2_i2.p1  ORF type:complete len:514 (-),score=156.12 TRINITY_DN462_c0_g2_i2:716-2257(-)
MSKSQITFVVCLIAVTSVMAMGPGPNGPNPPPNPNSPDQIYTNLKGVWRIPKTTPGCKTVVQFRFRNYAAYNVDPNCGSGKGAYMGTFAVTRKHLFIQYMVTPKTNPMRFDTFLWNITTGPNGPRLNLTNIKTKHQSIFEKSPVDQQLNGIWDLKAHGQGMDSRVQIENGLYLSHTVQNAQKLQVGQSFFGMLTHNMTDAKLSYAMIPPGMSFVVAQNYDIKFRARMGPGGNKYDIWRTTAPLIFNSTFMHKLPPTPRFDGVWAGVSGNCRVTVDFNSVLYRSYTVCKRTGGKGNNITTNDAYIGMFKPVNMTHMSLSYGFTTNMQKKGAFEYQRYTFGNGNNTLMLKTEQGHMTRLRRVTRPPGGVALSLRLKGNFASFNETIKAKILERLAERANISVAQIIVLGERSGSIILDLAIVDEQGETDKSAQSAFNNIANLGSIEGFDVLSIQETDNNNADPTPTPSGTPTPTPTPSSSASPTPTPTPAASDASLLSASSMLAFVLAAIVIAVM